MIIKAMDLKGNEIDEKDIEGLVLNNSLCNSIIYDALEFLKNEDKDEK